MQVRHDYHDLVRRDVFDVVPADAGRVLDLGGGIGATGAALKAAGRAEAVILADQVADGVADGIDEAFVGDLEDVNFVKSVFAKAGPFDTVLCLDVLEHLRDPWALIPQIQRGLADGGTLVISLPNVNYIGLTGPLVIKGRFDLTDQGILDRTHLRWFVRKSIVDLATGTGLKLRQTKANILGRKKRLLNALTLGLFERFLALQYVVSVQRT